MCAPSRAVPDAKPKRRPGVCALLVAVAVTMPSWGCAGGGTTASPTPAMPETPENVWESLHQPRPEPLQGAAAVSVSEILLLGDPWELHAPIPTSIGIQELVGAELLRRRDVNYVERRRFAAAAERERRGERRPPGAPPSRAGPGSERSRSLPCRSDPLWRRSRKRPADRRRTWPTSWPRR